MKISGNIIDVLRARVFPGTLEIQESGITDISEDKKRPSLSCPACHSNIEADRKGPF
jgi:hypothetical protein